MRAAEEINTVHKPQNDQLHLRTLVCPSFALLSSTFSVVPLSYLIVFAGSYGFDNRHAVHEH